MLTTLINALIDLVTTALVVAALLITCTALTHPGHHAAHTPDNRQPTLVWKEGQAVAVREHKRSGGAGIAALCLPDRYVVVQQ